MSRRWCAVLLAAGEGTRLRPLTGIRPKALCPIGNVPLLDRALAAAATLGLSGPADVAVNAWHLPDAIVNHCAPPPPPPPPSPATPVDPGVSCRIDGVSRAQLQDQLATGSVGPVPAAIVSAGRWP
jgi:MobA-like NTP transferase domain